MITTMMLNVTQKQMKVLHTKIVDENNIESAMLSQLFYASTLHGMPSSKAHSNVAYYKTDSIDANGSIRHKPSSIE